MVGGPMSRIFQVLLLGPFVSMIEKKKMGLLIHKPNKDDQNALKELFEAGKIVPIIDRRYPLSDVAQAIQYLGEGHPKGKVIVRIEHEVN
ncbi:zinc-binding dehydrogenase [Paenibacillus sp. LPE1-1-1.1]|uniref:zinc-binding dehydrogenase n=1 Tax=Paenibacillus sp. LPE1-1-1.1 TaxID=3135230 RepID=UPI003449C7AA